MRKLLKIDAQLKYYKVLTIASLSTVVVTVLVSLLYTFHLNKKLIKERVYFLDRSGEAFTAKIIKDELLFRDPEIKSHLKKFHNYFFNIDQFNYKQSIDNSLNLIDDSGKNYYLTLLANGWYNTLKMNNLVQKIELDSLEVNSDVYPYIASIFGKTLVYRHGDEKNNKVRKIKIACKLYDVARTNDNPHGLLISDYNIIYHGEE